MQRIIHQIWVGPYRIPKREQGFMADIQHAHPLHEHRLWTDANLPPMPEAVRATYDMFGRLKDYALQADVLRVHVVYEFGGTYLDLDLENTGGLDALDLDAKAGFFCGHWGDDYTIPNTAFGAEKGNAIIGYLRDRIVPTYNWYGPSWMGDTVKKRYDWPRETDHDLLKSRLESENFRYVRWSVFEAKHFRHHGLYSWAPENKARFEQGLVE